jgi:hypothetical protein
MTFRFRTSVIEAARSVVPLVLRFSADGKESGLVPMTAARSSASGPPA